MGAAFYFAGGAALKFLARAGATAKTAQAVAAGSQLFARYVSRLGPLYSGLELPQFFSIITEAGEVFIKQTATERLEELLIAAGEAEPPNLQPHWRIEEVKAVIETAAIEGLDQIAGKVIVTLTADNILLKL